MATPVISVEASIGGFSKSKILNLKNLMLYKPLIVEKDNSGQENKNSPQIYFEDKKKKEVPEYDYDVKKIKEAAEFASSATGVRKDFIMGMLVVESDLGRNTGGCTYGEVESGAESSYINGGLSQRAWNTFQKRRETFKGIAEGLEYDYKQLKVSCNPSRYYGTGGAMGIPQFMPDTWKEYEDRIAELSGKETPDPWDVRDGVIAMALKLSDVPGVKNHNYYAERNAAKLYLSGTTSWQYNWYANEILYWANNYNQLLG